MGCCHSAVGLTEPLLGTEKSYSGGDPVALTSRSQRKASSDSVERPLAVHVVHAQESNSNGASTQHFFDNVGTQDETQKLPFETADSESRRADEPEERERKLEQQREEEDRKNEKKRFEEERQEREENDRNELRRAEEELAAQRKEEEARAKLAQEERKVEEQRQEEERRKEAEVQRQKEQREAEEAQTRADLAREQHRQEEERREADAREEAERQSKAAEEKERIEADRSRETVLQEEERADKGQRMEENRQKNELTWQQERNQEQGKLTQTSALPEEARRPLALMCKASGLGLDDGDMGFRTFMVELRDVHDRPVLGSGEVDMAAMRSLFQEDAAPGPCWVGCKLPFDVRVRREHSPTSNHHGAQVIPIEVADIGEGRFEVTYDTEDPGCYTVEVLIDDEMLPSFPISVQVQSEEAQSEQVEADTHLALSTEEAEPQRLEELQRREEEAWLARQEEKQRQEGKLRAEQSHIDQLQTNQQERQLEEPQPDFAVGEFIEARWEGTFYHARLDSLASDGKHDVTFTDWPELPLRVPSSALRKLDRRNHEED